MENLFIISRTIPGYGQERFYLGSDMGQPLWFVDVQKAIKFNQTELNAELEIRKDLKHLYKIEQVQ